MTPATVQEYLLLVARHLLVESVTPAVEVRFSLRGGVGSKGPHVWGKRGRDWIPSAYLRHLLNPVFQ